MCAGGYIYIYIYIFGMYIIASICRPLAIGACLVFELHEHGCRLGAFVELLLACMSCIMWVVLVKSLA